MNNKQTMKLYTEEQVRKALKMALGPLKISTENYFINSLTPIELPSDSLCINCDESKSTHNVCMDCIIKIGKENIQLPSDEEIDRISFETYRDCPNNPNEHPEWEYNKDFNAPRKRRAFNKGAKWMRDKIRR